MSEVDVSEVDVSEADVSEGDVDVVVASITGTGSRVSGDDGNTGCG